MLAAYKEIETIEGEEETVAPGVVPAGWCAQRMITTGVATDLAGEFIVVGSLETLAELRPHFASRALHYGLPDLDAASIRAAAPRAFTQELSAHIWEQSDPNGIPYAGVRYLSRYGDELENWAIFERESMHGESPVLAISRDYVDLGDDDLEHALDLLDLVLGD